MELKEVIEKRRSIRKYLDSPIEEAKILELIESARLCQSAKNIQPWRFLIASKEQKDKIVALMYDWSEKVEKGDERYAKAASVKMTADVMKQAPVLILVFSLSNSINDLISIGAAIEHICLTATDQGLGSLWIRNTAVVEEEIKDLVGIKDLEFNSAISIGYADKIPEARPRKTIDEIML